MAIKLANQTLSSTACLQRVEKRVQKGRRVALTKRMVDAHRRRQLVGKALGRGMALIA
jgi:hypothetical protein